jgi:hypothetical protein
MASTASHPTITKEATAPAVILAFSFALYGRIQRLGCGPRNPKETAPARGRAEADQSTGAGAARQIPTNRQIPGCGALRHLTSNGGANSGGASDDGASPSDGGANPSGGGASPSGGGGASPNGGAPSPDVALVPSPDVLPARARARAPLRASDVPPRRQW